MVKAFVVYDTKYGNTKLVAEKIVEGMREVEGIETVISDVKEVKRARDIHRCCHGQALIHGRRSRSERS